MDLLREILLYPQEIKAKLNQNESPFPPPENILSEVCESLKVANRYQTAYLFDRVRSLYSQYSNVPMENIWLAPGIDIFFEKVFYKISGGKILVVYPTYFLFLDQAKFFGVKLVKTTLDENFNIVLEDFFEKLKRVDALYIDNPNNPTGKTLLNKKIFEEILDSFSGYVIVDEAYYEFSKKTFAEFVEYHEKLAVMRTLSKAFSMAGLRVSIYLLGRGFMELIHKNTEMFRIPTPSLVAAKAALENIEYVEKLVKFIEGEKRKMFDKLNSIGYKAYPSETNFLLVKTGIKNIVEQLNSVGILVKDVSNLLEPGYIRVTIGSAEENEAFLEAMEKIKQKQLNLSQT